MKVGGEERSFLIDSGASISAINQPMGKKTKDSIVLVGATGKGGKQPVFQIDNCQIKGRNFTHKFALVPQCPLNLLGRDLLCRLQARLTFTADGRTILDLPKQAEDRMWGEVEAPVHMLWKYSSVWQGPEVVQMMASEERDAKHWNLEAGIFDQVPSEVWAENGGYGMAVNHPPICIALKPGCKPVRLPQYPIPQEKRLGLQPILQGYLKEGILVEVRSEWNSPLYPVEKRVPGQYRPVHDLRAVNARVEPMTPLVADPYTLLSKLSPQHVWYSAVDIKDAFFTIRIAPSAIPMFAFTWEDPETGVKKQLAWGRLPQGFVHSPSFFAEALERDLQMMEKPPDVIVLQYVDDVLLAAKSWETCVEATVVLIQHLYQCGYKLSKAKAQLVRNKVEYLGFGLEKGQRVLTPERVAAICSVQSPKTRKGVRAILGMIGYCRLWIPNHAELAQPLYEATRGKESDPFVWAKDQENALQALKEALTQGPALGLPDTSQPFSLFATESKGIAKGVLTQTLLGSQRPCAYLSKKLDSVAAGFPGCLRMVAAVALLLHDAKKITFGGKIVIRTTHALRPLLMEGGMNWMSNSRAFKYQMRLLEDPTVEFQACTVLNPSTFLPDHEDVCTPLHDCVTTIQQNWKPRPDLKDQPLKNSDLIYFIDGSSSVENGERKTGYSVVTQNPPTVIEAMALPSSASAQAAELIAMIRALELAEGKTVNIYSDSKWVCLLIHAHAQLYREKGMVDSKGKEIKYKKLIETLLRVIQLPKGVAVMHCRGHQKGNTPIVKGNAFADLTAKKAAREQTEVRGWELQKQTGVWVLQQSLHPNASELTPHQPPQQETVLPLMPDLEGIEQTWIYEERDIKQAQSLGATQKHQWWVLPDGRIFIPCLEVSNLVQSYHESTHSGAEAMYEAIKRHFYAPNLSTHTRSVVSHCITCEVTNPRHGRLPPPGFVERGLEPMEVLQIDFTDMPRCGPYKYLLVAVCSLTGWVEAKPCKTEKAREVVKWLLENLIPFHGLPRNLNSDNGGAFLAKVVQDTAEALGIVWKLHASLRPTSSGKVERMNATIKSLLTKLVLETGETWVTLLPQVLFRIRNTPNKSTKLTPFECLFGRPSPVWRAFKPVENTPQRLQDWGKEIAKLRKYLKATIPLNVVDPVHNIVPGDWVLVRKWKNEPLKPAYIGPYQVLLIAPSAVKCLGIKAWIHVTRVKPVAAPKEWTSRPTGDLRLKISSQPAH